MLEYQEQFEDVKLKLEKKYPAIDEEFYISSFLAGLKPEIRSGVRSHRIPDIYTAIKLAKYQEQYLKDVLESWKPKTQFTPKPKIWTPNTTSKPIFQPPKHLNHLILNLPLLTLLNEILECAGNVGRNIFQDTNVPL